MKTKKLEYYVDLPDGWQDRFNNPHFAGWTPYLCLFPTWPLEEGSKRIKVIIHLPCFGGSCDASGTIESSSEPVDVGYRD